MQGGAKYRKLLALLDEAGVTANIVRIAPDWFELHQDFEIIKKARTRGTINRQLVKIAKQTLNPTNTMDFFKQLTEATPQLDATIRIMAAKSGSITVHYLPATGNIKPLELTGMPEDIDAGFFETMGKYTRVTGLVSNLPDLEAEAEKKGTAKPAPAKTTKVKEETNTEKSKDSEAVVFPWPAGSRVIVTGPGKFRAKKGHVNDVAVNDKGEVNVEFIEGGSESIPVKDLAIDKQAESAQPELKPSIHPAGAKVRVNAAGSNKGRIGAIADGMLSAEGTVRIEFASEPGMGFWYADADLEPIGAATTSKAPAPPVPAPPPPPPPPAA